MSWQDSHLPRWGLDVRPVNQALVSGTSLLRGIASWTFHFRHLPIGDDHYWILMQRTSQDQLNWKSGACPKDATILAKRPCSYSEHFSIVSFSVQSQISTRRLCWSGLFLFRPNQASGWLKALLWSRNQAFEWAIACILPLRFAFVGLYQQNRYYDRSKSSFWLRLSHLCSQSCSSGFLYGILDCDAEVLTDARNWIAL